MAADHSSFFQQSIMEDKKARLRSLNALRKSQNQAAKAAWRRRHREVVDPWTIDQAHWERREIKKEEKKKEDDERWQRETWRMNKNDIGIGEQAMNQKGEKRKGLQLVGKKWLGRWCKQEESNGWDSTSGKTSGWCIMVKIEKDKVQEKEKKEKQLADTPIDEVNTLVDEEEKQKKQQDVVDVSSEEEKEEKQEKVKKLLRRTSSKLAPTEIDSSPEEEKEKEKKKKEEEDEEGNKELAGQKEWDEMMEDSFLAGWLKMQEDRVSENQH